MARSSRLANAHHRLRITRYVIGVAAAGAFAAGAVVVRAAHPAGNSARSGSSQATQSTSSDATEGDPSGSSSDDSGSYLSPATSPPIIQSSGS